IDLGNRTLTYAGDVTWAAGNIQLLSGAVWRNQAGNTFTAQAAGQFVFTNSSGAFANAGALVASAAGTVTVSSLFANSGTVSVPAGTLQLQGDGTHTGSFGVAA